MMKKYATLLLLLVCCQLTYGQYYPYELTVYGRTYKGITPKKTNKLASELDSSFNGKGKFKGSNYTTYNRYGLTTYREWDKGRKKTYYTFYRDSIYQSAYTLHKGDTGGFWCYSFVENGSPICYRYGYKKAKNIRVTDSTQYDAKGRKIKVSNYGHKNKLTGYGTYTYSDSGTMAEYRSYDKKDKLRSVYSYSCDAKGEVLKNVKQTSYCKSGGVHEDGRFYEVVEARNEKGKLRRQVYTYSKDSLLLEYEYSDINGKPKGKNKYQYNAAGFIETFNNYNAKGRLSFSYRYETNDKGYRIAWWQYNKKGKLTGLEKSYYTWFE